MARESGVEGFVFYYYWFNRKRLLDKPLDLLLEHPEINLPFCLMWANENWSRQWDGGENDIIVSQDYRVEDDLALIADFARHMRDPRYITAEGRPLLMIYRPGSIPESASRIRRWRSLFRDEHRLDPILIMAQGFKDNDPRPFGMDGAIEFPPHKLTESCEPIEGKLQILDEEMTSRVYDYAELVDHALHDDASPFPRIRTATPSWDNDARRQGGGMVLQGSTPHLFERWMHGLIEQAHRSPFFGENFVCINAWNEWGEGAYLEPDVHFGSAYLNATARAVTRFATVRAPQKILLVGHDLFQAGAQKLLLEIGARLKRNHGCEILFVTMAGGAMLGQYRSVAPVEILPPNAPATMLRLSGLRAEGYRTAIVNSAASCDQAFL